MVVALAYLLQLLCINNSQLVIKSDYGKHWTMWTGVSDNADVKVC